MPKTLPAHAQPSSPEMEMLKIHPQTSASSLGSSECSSQYDARRISPIHLPSISDQSTGHANHHLNTYGDWSADNNDGKTPTQTQPHHDIFRYWKWEVGSLALALGSLITALVLIRQYDNQPTPEWTFPLNLATLLSFLATIFRIFLLVPITSVISQAKWDWVGRDQVRRLKDIQEIDNASRGPWGALRVIPLAAKGNVPIFVAAVSSLLILGSGPFIQQAMTTVECERQSDMGPTVAAFAHFVPVYSNYVQRSGPRHVVPKYELELMIQTCQANANTFGPQSILTFNCPTGNCTFPGGDPVEGGGVSHSSIGLCSRCFDTSPLISRVTNSSFGSKIVLPNGSEIRQPGIDSSVDSDLTWAASMMPAADVRRLAGATILNVTTLIGYGETQAQGAVTCMLYVCLRTYQTSVRGGQLNETQLSSVPASPNLLKDPGEKNSSLVVINSPCMSGNLVYTTGNMSTAPNGMSLSLCEATDDGSPCQVRNMSAPVECIYRHDSTFSEAMRGMLTTAFIGSCSLDALDEQNTTCESDLSSTTRWNLDLYHLPQFTIPAPTNWSITTRTKDVFDNFAASVSGWYRRNYGGGANSSYPLDQQNQLAGQIGGQAWQTMSCNSAQLPWLILPAGLTMVTAALLAWVINRGRTRRTVQPIWKDSLLPLILYKDRLMLLPEEKQDTGISVQGLEQQHTSLMELKDINVLAAKIPVLFRWDELPSLRGNGLRKRNRQESDVDSLFQQS
ncbi:hypothetical protein PG987_006965 [Apiospora arundinis]